MAVRYNPDARDADLDRIVQEGTPFARPATPRIEMATGRFKYRDVTPENFPHRRRIEVSDSSGNVLGTVDVHSKISRRRVVEEFWPQMAGSVGHRTLADAARALRDRSGPRIEMAEPRVPRVGVKKKWTKEEALAFANEAWAGIFPASDGSGTFMTHIWGVTDIADAEGEEPEWMAEIGMRFRPTGSDEWEETNADIERYWEPHKPEVGHAWLVLPPEHRHKGFATAFGDHEDRAYRAAGIKRITLTAGGADGPYVWALEGYQFDDRRTKPGPEGRGRDEIAAALEEILLGDWGGLTPEARAEGTDLLTRAGGLQGHAL